MEVKAKIPELSKEVSVEYDFGSNLDEASEKFGPETVYEGFLAEAVISLQSIIRAAARAGKTDEETNTIVADWKPGVSRRGKADPVAGLMAKFGKMTPEQQKALIDKLITGK